MCGKWRRRSWAEELGVGEVKEGGGGRGRREEKEGGGGGTISCTGSIDVRLSTVIPTESVALRRLSTKRHCTNHWLLPILFLFLTNFNSILFPLSCLLLYFI